jgi:hypothetical protein
LIGPRAIFAPRTGAGYPRATGWMAALWLIAFTVGCAHKSQIAGTINTRDFVIPAGEVVIAVDNVTINASHMVKVDGALYVAPGASVVFRSPSIDVPGIVQNMSAHVSWWRRTQFVMSMIPQDISQRADRLLGRTPNYWNRGRLDCISPALQTPQVPKGTQLSGRAQANQKP